MTDNTAFIVGFSAVGLLIGISTLTMAVWGFVLADEPTRTEYHSYVNSCDEFYEDNAGEPYRVRNGTEYEIKTVNKDDLRECQNTTYAEYRQEKAGMFLATPFSIRPFLFWALAGIAATTPAAFEIRNMVRET
ncbi:hypothetical protein [Haloarcula amylovorans]|uniref:hypothetical protein n=1 Tax=Haloarcula amylovorans TaxID=2562280 RepID=UPI0010769323|nr:hypothetical protein [Halomicroarcula amylolytica]